MGIASSLLVEFAGNLAENAVPASLAARGRESQHGNWQGSIGRHPHPAAGTEDLKFVHGLDNNANVMRYWFEEPYEAFVELQDLYNKHP